MFLEKQSLVLFPWKQSHVPSGNKWQSACVKGAPGASVGLLLFAKPAEWAMGEWEAGLSLTNNPNLQGDSEPQLCPFFWGKCTSGHSGHSSSQSTRLIPLQLTTKGSSLRADGCAEPEPKPRWRPPMGLELQKHSLLRADTSWLAGCPYHPSASRVP